MNSISIYFLISAYYWDRGIVTYQTFEKEGGSVFLETGISNQVFGNNSG